MPLMYAVVARQNVVLARHALSVGNFAEVTEKILSRIDETKNKKMSYSSDSYMYHYISDNNLTFLCITDESFNRSSAFAFLGAIVKKFETQFGSPRGAIPLAMNSEFAPILNSEMRKFNLIEDQNRLIPTDEDEDESQAGPSSMSDHKISRVRNEVDRVKDIMVNSIDTIMERGERLELLVDKTENLSQHSVQFKQASRTLRRKMWWENKKMVLIVAFAIIISIYIIVSISCGGLAWQKCVGSNSNSTGSN